MAFVDTPIVERIAWADGLWSLRLEVTPTFEPGQFVNLALEIDGALVKRSYSLASAPGARAEFYLVRVDGGALTPALDRLAVGDRVKIGTTPQGFFTLAHVPAARDLWLVCTGTGLGPFMSMLRAGDVFARFERVVLVHGTRTADQLGYRAELEALAAREPALVYLPMLTRDRGAALSGRIPAALGDGRLERAASCALDPAHSHLMLCGNPAMIGDAVDALAPRGLRKHRTRAPGHISAEKYW